MFNTYIDLNHNCQTLDKAELKITADGSHTIYLPELDETYHSVHGSIQEAVHVFINAGINYFDEEKELNILEIGFGTGLNAFLSYQQCKTRLGKIHYTSLEAFPLASEVVSQLNFLKELKADDNDEEVFNQMHNSEWEESIELSDQFNLLKIKTQVQDFTVTKKYDLIFFDAFGPRVQPEMWDKEVMAKMFEVLNSSGILVTYCAKGSVKRTLKEVGFEIEALPGPPGKREMTRALKL